MKPSGLLLGAAVATVVVAIGSLFLFSGGGDEAPSGIVLPTYVRSAPADMRAAYTYAVGHPEVLQYIPCYCGCGDHAGHQSVWNCFVQTMDGTIVVFDDHGSGCQMCIDIALDARELVEGGEGLTAARQVIDARYSYVGPSTNTPWPE